MEQFMNDVKLLSWSDGTRYTVTGMIAVLLSIVIVFNVRMPVSLLNMLNNWVFKFALVALGVVIGVFCKPKNMLMCSFFIFLVILLMNNLRAMETMALIEDDSMSSIPKFAYYRCEDEVPENADEEAKEVNDAPEVKDVPVESNGVDGANGTVHSKQYVSEPGNDCNKVYGLYHPHKLSRHQYCLDMRRVACGKNSKVEPNGKVFPTYSPF